MKLISPIESVFMLAETPRQPMHVAGLQVFQPPAGAGPEFVRDLHTALLGRTDVQPGFRQHPAPLPGGIPSLGWSFDGEVDLDYHVRRSGLPGPGRVRELLTLVSQLHATSLERSRPLWESYVIEGLKDGRFAIYTKMHHALVDGISALRLLQGSLSSDPHSGEIRAPWESSAQGPISQAERSGLLRRLADTAATVGALGPSSLSLGRAALTEQQLTMPFRAPRTMLNVPIGSARRCVADSWALDRITEVKKAAGVTLNDVVLAMCSGALRQYLIDQDALPDSPLVAMVPVSLRTERDAQGGNLVGGVLANLATDQEDPADRLQTIHSSVAVSKRILTELPRPQAMALSMLLLAPSALSVVPGFSSATPPPFNVCISNVPGVRHPLHLSGARLTGNYPMSIVTDGQALNITLATSADSLDFGLVGCRRSVPHLQRMLGHLETSLKDLERAVGL